MTRQEIIDYCLTLPTTYEDYPFDSITDPGKWTVMRHKTNKKSFAMIKMIKLTKWRRPQLSCLPGNRIFI